MKWLRHGDVPRGAVPEAVQQKVLRTLVWEEESGLMGWFYGTCEGLGTVCTTTMYPDPWGGWHMQRQLVAREFHPQTEERVGGLERANVETFAKWRGTRKKGYVPWCRQCWEAYLRSSMATEDGWRWVFFANKQEVYMAYQQKKGQKGGRGKGDGTYRAAKLLAWATQ